MHILLWHQGGQEIESTTMINLDTREQRVFTCWISVRYFARLSPILAIHEGVIYSLPVCSAPRPWERYWKSEKKEIVSGSATIHASEGRPEQ